MAGYRVRDGEWEEIGRESPKKPQMFYPVSHPGMTVHKGDLLVSGGGVGVLGEGGSHSPITLLPLLKKSN